MNQAIKRIFHFLGKLWVKFRYSRFGIKFRSFFPNEMVNSSKHFLLAVLAAIYYRNPSQILKLVGVTGTDGKTTTVNLIYHMLKIAGKKVSMVSTLKVVIGEQTSQAGFHVTSPRSFDVQKLLRQAVDVGSEYCVLEVTSQGLVQHRFRGCNFQIGVVTNVTPEHLDYHKTFEKYLQAKSKLFRGVKYAVLNKDDDSYRYLKSAISNQQSAIITYGIKNKADITPKTFPFRTKLLGEFNQYNCLAAISVARILNIPDEKIRKALLSFSAPKGRLEEIKAGQDFKVFVDFAHTPGAFRQVIPTVRELTKGRIIHVFGCTGDRDEEKRSIMGETTAKFDDLIILTHEDTYTEDPRKIIEMIEVGVRKGGKVLGQTYWKIPDRKKAIQKAISLAKKNDLVLITGVGHQVSLNIGGKEVPWSDQNAVKEIIEKHS